MTIAEVSRRYAISADTLRYYERIGLIPPVPRNKSGIRDYDEESCRWIELMKCMRAAGVAWGFRGTEELEREGADFIAHTPDDLLRIVQG